MAAAKAQQLQKVRRIEDPDGGEFSNSTASGNIWVNTEEEMIISLDLSLLSDTPKHFAVSTFQDKLDEFQWIRGLGEKLFLT